MLRTLWGSLQALFALFNLGSDPADMPSAGSDLGPTVDPNG